MQAQVVGEEAGPSTAPNDKYQQKYKDLKKRVRDIEQVQTRLMVEPRKTTSY